MVSNILLVAAIIAFVLAALSVAVGDLALVPIGLALLAASLLPLDD